MSPAGHDQKQVAPHRLKGMGKRKLICLLPFREPDKAGSLKFVHGTTHQKIADL